MKYYLLAVSSLTNANRGQKALYEAGVAGVVVKTPTYLSPKGCSNSIKINGSHFLTANNALSKAGLTIVKVFGSNDDIRYSEV